MTGDGDDTPARGADRADRAADRSDHANDEEVARFLREQPPQPIPPRTPARTVPGLVALPILGYRVVRRLD